MHEDIPELPWRDARSMFLDWQQGQHITLIGTTGDGKTTFAGEILQRRSHVAVFASKPRDRVISTYGYQRIRTWPPPPNAKKVMLWPSRRGMDDTDSIGQAFADALEQIHTQGNWAVYIDELGFIAEELPRVESRLKTLWREGRALGISVVASTQRPAWVPLVAYSQASWIIAWRNTDARDRRRIGEVGGGMAKPMVDTLPDLDDHEAVVLNLRNGQAFRTTVDTEKVA